VNLGFALLALQRIGPARQVLTQAEARHLDELNIHVNLYAADFLLGDAAAMAKELSWLESRSEYRSQGLSQESDTAAYSGQLRRAEQLTDQSIQAALQVNKQRNGSHVAS